jgi:hypothetical protein
MLVIMVGADDTAGGTAEDRLLANALSARGGSVMYGGWDDPGIDWGNLDRVVIRSPWTVYRHGRLDEFLVWARKVAGMTTVLPDPEILEWNTHKGYLTSLSTMGVASIPTRIIGPGDPWAEGFEAGPVVAKPAVGCSGHGTRLLHLPAESALLDQMTAHGDVAVQPYRPQVTELGERSVIVIDGLATHAVVKYPGHDDFRVQRHFGGRVEPLELTGNVAEHAEGVVSLAAERFGTPIPWARVDELLGTDGSPELLEFEATDPWLHLEHSAEATARMAATILR